MLRLTPAAFLAALVACLPLALGARTAPAVQADPAAAAQALPITVVCLRHAEKVLDGGRDPALDPAGEERARALARLLAHAGVTHLYASEFRRTQATLAPLAQALELETVPHPARDAAGLASALRALPPGSVAVVAGHSNTVPALVAALGGAIEQLEVHERYGPILGEDEHDRLFVVTLPHDADQAVATLELRYGD